MDKINIMHPKFKQWLVEQPYISSKIGNGFRVKTEYFLYYVEWSWKEIIQFYTHYDYDYRGNK
jgi:hypothetical protein